MIVCFSVYGRLIHAAVITSVTSTWTDVSVHEGTNNIIVIVQDSSYVPKKDKHALNIIRHSRRAYIAIFVSLYCK